MRDLRERAPASRLVSLVVTLGLFGASLGGVTAGGAPSGSFEALLQDFGMRPLSGDPPPLSLPGLDGQRYGRETARGRVVLLYFWATW